MEEVRGAAVAGLALAMEVATGGGTRAQTAAEWATLWGLEDGGRGKKKVSQYIDESLRFKYCAGTTVEHEPVTS